MYSQYLQSRGKNIRPVYIVRLSQNRQQKDEYMKSCHLSLHTFLQITQQSYLAPDSHICCHVDTAFSGRDEGMSRGRHTIRQMTKRNKLGIMLLFLKGLEIVPERSLAIWKAH